MPIFMLAVVGGFLGLLLYQWGRITGDKLLAAFYAVAGATIAILILTRFIGGMGPLPVVIAAAAGAVLLLYFGRMTGGRKDDE